MPTQATAKQRQPRSDETPARQRIVEAAFSAFMESGFAAASTLEIATRARVSKRELYALVGSKQEMLVACIRERARRLQMPDLPEPHDRQALARTLETFGTQLLREVSDPTVIAVFRLAIAEAVRAPEVARALNSLGVETKSEGKPAASRRRAAEPPRDRPTRPRRHRSLPETLSATGQGRECRLARTKFKPVKFHCPLREQYGVLGLAILRGDAFERVESHLI